MDRRWKEEQELFLAGWHEDIDTIRAIAQGRKGRDLKKNPDYKTPYIMPSGMLVDVELLEDRGLINEIDELDDYGFALLHLAAMQGHNDAIKYSLELGADPSVLCLAGYTPLFWAKWAGNDEGVKLLVNAGGVPDGDSSTRLKVWLAAYSERIEEIEKVAAQLQEEVTVENVRAEKLEWLAFSGKVEEAARKMSRLSRDIESLNERMRDSVFGTGGCEIGIN